MGVSSSPDNSGREDLSFYKRYFAQRAVCPDELPGIMRRHIYTGALGNVWGFLISGVFFVYFGNAIGMSPADWGVLTGLSSFLLSAEVLSARITRQVGRRKVLWFWFAVACRSVRLLGVILSYWLFHAGHRHAGIVLIASVCLSNFFGAMGNPPWWSWLADIIPSARHGRFWARRTWWVNVSVIFAVLPAAWVMDAMDEEWKLTAAVGVFFVATVIGLLDLLIHGTIPEPAMVVPERENFFQQFMTPIRDKGYRRWLLFTACWTFGMSLGGALATVYLLGDLGLKDNMLAAVVAWVIFSQLGTLLGSRKWGLYVDRYGVKPVLFWGYLFWSSWPLFWFFATKNTALYLVGISSLIGGSSSNAGTIAATKLITRYPPPGHHVATYSAVSNFVSNWMSGLACLVAGFTVKLIGPGHIDRFGISFTAFHVLFAVSFLMRTGFTLFLIPRLKMPDHLAEVPSPAPGEPGHGEEEWEERSDWTSLLRP